MILKVTELHHSIGSLMIGLTEVRRPIEIIWAITVQRPLKRQRKKKKKKWCRRESNPGLPRLKPEALHLSGSLFCDEAQILSKSCDILCLVFPHYISCLLQVVIVLEFLHKSDLRHFLLSLTPEYVNCLLHMCITN